MKNDNLFKFFFKNKILILKACTTNLENRCHLSMLESWKPAPSGSWQMRCTQQCFFASIQGQIMSALQIIDIRQHEFS